ncbi:MAG: hypothetical protein GVY08_06585 [Bacteroidetes bacterium]|jgi:hypothetical protein|nr:hypothetical protein [Bacteroidota bacterium]
MTDYSDIIFLMGAMVLFSFLMMSVNRTILMNDRSSLDHEIEYYALAIAQERVDELRWVTSESELDSELASYPKTIMYSRDSGTADAIPFIVDIEKNTAPFENHNIRSVELLIGVNSEYALDGTTGEPVQLAFTKSFVK